MEISFLKNIVNGPNNNVRFDFCFVGMPYNDHDHDDDDDDN